MTRTARHDVDYFPFYVKDGKSLFILESKYGLQGIGFFTNLMRFLCRQPDHHICIEDEPDRLYFFAQIRCHEDIGMDMLNLMAKTGKIDAELWLSRRVILSEDLLDSLKEAYRNRVNPIIEIDQIRISYPIKAITDAEKRITNTDYPQTKLNQTKLKESKRDIPPKTKFLDSVFLSEPEYKKLQEALGQKSLDSGIEKLDYSITVKGGKYKDHYKTLLNWSKRGFLAGDGGNRHAGIKAWLERDNEEARQGEICEGDGSPVRDI